MGITRKKRGDTCLNCGHPLGPHINYCPACGQENTTQKLSVKEVLQELVENTFTVDSRLAKSAAPFLFRPGMLTKAWVNGQRRKYVSPVRFYLIISFLFFITLSFNAYDSGKVINLQGLDLGVMTSENEFGQISLFGTDLDNFSGSRLDSLLLQPDMDADTLLDSLGAKEKSFMARLTTKQFMRLYKNPAGQEQLSNEVIRNIPRALFLFLPFFALTLKVFYWQNYYVEHLVFAFHLHTFFFFILWLALLSAIFFDFTFYGTSALIAGLYAFVMLKNVYKNTWFWTFMKFNALSLIYLLLLTFGVILEIAISTFIF